MNIMELENLEEMEEKLVSILEKRTPIVSTDMIALIASKRNFNIEKETELMEKARTTVCKCHHFTNTTPCLYRRYRHMPENHFSLNRPRLVNELGVSHAVGDKKWHIISKGHEELTEKPATGGVMQTPADLQWIFGDTITIIANQRECSLCHLTSEYHHVAEMILFRKVYQHGILHRHIQKCCYDNE
jgi:hypothetical protein